MVYPHLTEAPDRFRNMRQLRSVLSQDLYLTTLKPDCEFRPRTGSRSAM